MRVPLVLLNVVAAVWLVTAMGQRLAVRPLVAVAGALPFVMPAPVAASQLLETAGACVEPFIYILLLWRLRQRPFAFGAVLAVAFLHREFTVFAVPALLAVEAASGRAWDLANLRRAAIMGVGFGAVWLAVDAIKLYQAGGSLGLQAASLAGQMCFAPAELAPRITSVLTQALPTLYGGTFTRLLDFRMNTPVTSGSGALGWVLALVLGGMIGRLAWSWYRQPRLGAGEAFFVYLGLVGVFTAAAYPLSCNIMPGQPPLLRYILLALLLPIGCFGAFMSRERSRLLRAAVTAVFALWGAVNLAGNVTLLRASDQRAAVERAPRDRRLPREPPDPLCARHLLGRLRDRLPVARTRDRGLRRPRQDSRLPAAGRRERRHAPTTCRASRARADRRSRPGASSLPGNEQQAIRLRPCTSRSHEAHEAFSLEEEIFVTSWLRDKRDRIAAANRR